MKKKLLRGLTIALSSVFVLSTAIALAACAGRDEEDIQLEAEAKEKITFWGWGDNNERAVFSDLVKQFNQANRGEIYVNYEPQNSSNYGDRVDAAFGRTKASVDVLYINDESFKAYAEQGYLEPLDNYIANSSEIVIENMWESSMNRYLYDVDTTTQDGPNAHYWGIPKDIGPTVIFYNETQFTQAGVKVLSVAAENLEAFNAGTLKDDRGQSKADLGLTGRVQEKGYFEMGGQKYFNNQIPMSWDECIALASHVQSDQRARGNSKHYGYHTEWWFSYGWSVGGDCIEYIELDPADPEYDQYNGGYWDFTLMEDTPNYIVADDADPFTVDGGDTYQPGEIISWQDKLVDVKATDKQIKPEIIAAAAAGQLNQLPSQRDAFVEFVRVGQDQNTDVERGLKGYGVCPNPQTIQGDSGKILEFMNGALAMVVDLRYNVVDFRANICEIPGEPKRGGFEWDVAPLPMYKEYYQEGDTIPEGKEVGDIKVHGVEAGHSGSVALSINAKSTKKDAAWKFCEYIGGATGQAAQSKLGFAIPSQKDLAQDEEIFLQTNKCPQNSIIFLKAAEVQTPGDWWYLKNKQWINYNGDRWADYLNDDVRNGKATLSDFEKSQAFLGTYDILKDYTRKK